MNCINELTKRPFVRLCVHISLGICYLKSKLIVLASFQPNTTLASCRYGRATLTVQHLTATLTKTFSSLPFLVFWESVKCYLTSCTLVIVTVDSRTLFLCFQFTDILCYMLYACYIHVIYNIHMLYATATVHRLCSDSVQNGECATTAPSSDCCQNVNGVSPLVTSILFGFI